MNLNGQRTIHATVGQTWAGLNDPQVLQQCITGCKSIEADGADKYKVQLALKVGPVSARFTGQLRLEDIQPLASYKILFEGQGGTAGFGKGQASVSLQSVDDATRLTYSSQANVGGKLAQVGSRLIDSVAAKVAEDFFKSFEMLMQKQHAVDLPTGPLQHRSDSGEIPIPRSGINTLWRIALAVGVAGVALALGYFLVASTR
jgi:uncharacterized protein